MFFVLGRGRLAGWKRRPAPSRPNLQSRCKFIRSDNITKNLYSHLREFIMPIRSRHSITPVANIALYFSLEIV